MLKKDDPAHNYKPFYTERNDMSTTVMLIKVFVDKAISLIIFGDALPDVIDMESTITLDMPPTSKIRQLLSTVFTYRGYNLVIPELGSRVAHMVKTKTADALFYAENGDLKSGHWNDKKKEWVKEKIGPNHGKVSKVS